jgi:hypothetical protein
MEERRISRLGREGMAVNVGSIDGSKNPESTQPPALRGDPVQAGTSQYK